MGINPANRRELYEYIGVQLQEASFPDSIKVKELVEQARLSQKISFASKKTDREAFLTMSVTKFRLSIRNN